MFPSVLVDNVLLGRRVDESCPFRKSLDDDWVGNARDFEAKMLYLLLRLMKRDSLTPHRADPDPGLGFSESNQCVLATQ